MNIRRVIQALAINVGTGVLAASVHAQDGAVIELQDTVIGNQELPQVLYIVPWQSAEDTSIIFHPVHTKLGRDVFKHIERPEHLRELEYLEQLQQPAQPAGKK